MKKQIILGAILAVLAAVSAYGSLYTQTFSTSTAIPSGSPLGTVVTGTFNADPNAGDTVGGLTVELNLSGGYNGGLYAYLVAPNGTMVVLMNQPGTAPLYAPGSGMNVTLQDGASAGSLNTATEVAGQVLTGTYSAVGSLAGFNGSAADGTWELFFADLSSGGGTSVLNSWTLGITAVPEPVTMSLVVFAGLLALNWSLGRFWGCKAVKTRANSNPSAGML
jgi:subtilisin-like proprotein convertase family protein